MDKQKHCLNLNLSVLELVEDEVSDDEIDWISCFPTEGTSNLESLCFDFVESSINFDALERLVVRSPLLKKLSPLEGIGPQHDNIKLDFGKRGVVMVSGDDLVRVLQLLINTNH
ncbi:transport inhibitor response 1-like protein, partial [Tanacetum coccineum]